MIHQSIYSGLQLVVLPKFDLEDFCRFIQELKITFAYVVPPVVLLLGKHPVVEKYDLSTIRMMNSGAAPLTRELVDAVNKRLGIPIKQGYGLSETSPTTHTQPWSDWNRTIGSVGTLLPYQIAKYMSPEEKELPTGEVGELWIKGPNVFKGYLNNPEGTKNALTEDGYFKTGDVGYQDKDGNFFITDRVKELIKYKGFQVPPAELEGLLVSHPGVNDCAVIGVYDKDQATELPRAYVVPKDGLGKGETEAKEIVEWLGAKVAHHKKLRGGVRFVDEVSPAQTLLQLQLTSIADPQICVRQDSEARAQAESPGRAGWRCKGKVIEANIKIHMRISSFINLSPARLALVGSCYHSTDFLHLKPLHIPSATLNSSSISPQPSLFTIFLRSSSYSHTSSSSHRLSKMAIEASNTSSMLCNSASIVES